MEIDDDDDASCCDPNECCPEELSLEATYDKMLANDPSLTHVEIFDTDLSTTTPGGGMLVLAEGLRNNTAVTYLLLQGCRVGLDGVMALGEALSTNRALQHLALNDVSGVGDPGITLLMEGLSHHNNLQTMSLEYLDIGPFGAVAIMQFLSKNKSLFELNLNRNPLGDGGYAIAKGLMLNHCVHTLYLASCQITSPVGCAMFQALTGAEPAAARATDNGPPCCTLKFLDLSGNLLDDAVAGDLETMLRHNRTLQALAVCENELGPGAAGAVSAAMRSNDFLKCLNLGGNRLGLEGAQTLGENLPHVHGLKCLTLLQNTFDHQALSCIVKGLEGNRSLVKTSIGASTDIPPIFYQAARFYARRNEIAWRVLEDNDLPLSLWALLLSKLASVEKEEDNVDLLFFFIRERPALFSMV